MAVKQKGEILTKGDFLQISDSPCLYFQVTGGSAPNWEGRLTDDPSKWIGATDGRYKPAQQDD